MTTGEFPTRLTIWICLAAYAVGLVNFARSGTAGKQDSVTRIAWTAGVVALLIHVVCAFHFYHDWSHASAYSDTASQTNAVFHLNWGGGLYINYLLLTVWAGDMLWWWLAGIESYRRRPTGLIVAWHAFLVFIIFNATVVFKTGLVRWTGVAVSLILCLSLFKMVRFHFARRWKQCENSLSQEN